jgi:hypothetical protein
MAKKNNVEELMAQAREKMGEKPKVKKEKKKPKTVQEQYTAIKESMTPKVKENINEQELINELFNFQEEAAELLPEQEETKHREGL